MRVALVYAEVYDMARFRERRKEFPPFGVLYLAAALRESGHEVRIEACSTDRVALDLSGAEAVGFSIAASATFGLLKSCRFASTIDDDALVMVGGVHANFYPEMSLREFEAGVVAFGESDTTISEIVARSGRNFDGIAGVMWRDPDGRLRSIPPNPPERDISDLPLPARDLLPVDAVVMSDRLAGRDLRMAHVMLSRGCPFPCSFCAAGKTYLY